MGCSCRPKQDSQVVVVAATYSGAVGVSASHASGRQHPHQSRRARDGDIRRLSHDNDSWGRKFVLVAAGIAQRTQESYPLWRGRFDFDLARARWPLGVRLRATFFAVPLCLLSFASAHSIASDPHCVLLVPAVDVFAYGVVLWEVLTHTKPWADVKKKWDISEACGWHDAPTLASDTGVTVIRAGTGIRMHVSATWCPSW